MLSKYIYDEPASKELEVDLFSITQVIQYALIYDPCTLRYIIQKKTLTTNIEKLPFTYWLNGRWFPQNVDIHVGNFNIKLTGRWFPQIVDMDSGNLYPIYIKQKLWC